MLRRLAAFVRAWFAERRYLSASARWRATMLDYQVYRVLRKEHEDARDKRSSGFWSSGGHNVGKDVLEAVMDAEASLSQLPESDLRLHKALAVLVAAREEYRIKAWDPDGFGVATYHQIIRGFESLQKEHGKRARFTPRAFEWDLPPPFGPYRVVYDAPGQKDAAREGSKPDEPTLPP